MAISGFGSLGFTQGRADLFAARIDKAREAAFASNQEFIAAAERAGETAHADFSRVSYAQIAHHIGAADGVIYTTDLQRLADLASNDAGQRLDTVLRTNGLADALPPPKFKLDSRGQLAFEHPRKAEIAAALANDPTLAQDLQSAIGLQAGAARAQADSLYALAYQRAYTAAGPEAAGRLAQRYQATAAPNVSLTFGEGRLHAAVSGGDVNGYLQRVASQLGLGRGGLANLRV